MPLAFANLAANGPILPALQARSSVGERFLDTEEVTGSIPVSPTSNTAGQRTEEARTDHPTGPRLRPGRQVGRLSLLIEHPVHRLSAGQQHRPQLVPVHRLGHPCPGVTDEVTAICSMGVPLADSSETNECRSSRGVHC